METQIICEAKESKVTESLPLYCIEHEQMVQSEIWGDGEVGHIGVVCMGDYDEMTYCTFPRGYTFCPPPADDGDWAAQEPSLEEREEGERAEEGMWLGGGE